MGLKGERREMGARMMGRFGFIENAALRTVVVVVVSACGGGGGGTAEVELEAACGATEDEGIDGTVDVVWVHEIDGEGRIVEKAGDRDGDGEPEDAFMYEWNADGRLLVEEGPVRNFDHRYRYELVWDGVNLVEFRHSYDAGAGFEPVSRSTSTYADGPETEEVWDWDGDGDGDLVARGRLELQELDWDGDGEAETRETFEYEEERIVRSTALTDGAPMYVTWTYEDGALVAVEGFPSESVPPNQVPDYRETWTLDENDLVIEHTYYRRNLGANYTTTTVRDEQGRPVEIRMGEDVERMEYDGDRMVRHEIRATDEMTLYEFQFDCGG